MSKGPDLSAFPIPRKGGAKPIAMDEASEAEAAEEEGAGEGATTLRQLTPSPPAAALPRAEISPNAPQPATRQSGPANKNVPVAPVPSGQTVATTVKLDENRYLRLADAGKPGPGRLKRRTIQEMVVEALDEWFERRGI